jgi:phage shock protein C
MVGMANRLQRSRNERIIGGVCGGLAEYFDVDPVLVRVILVVITLMGGAGILLYLILWAVVPLAPPPPPEAV